MEIKDFSTIAELGIAGVAVVGLLVLIFFIIKGHKEERKELYKDIKEGRSETNNVIKELTTVIDTINRSRRG